PTLTTETEYPLDFNDETVSHIIESHGIHDKDAFMHFANAYDEDQNGYLKHSELSRAAHFFVSTGRIVHPPVKTTPDPRLLAVAEVRSAMPDWTDEKINSWMDNGWSAKQIIDNYGTPSPPPAPVGFGDDFEPPVVESQPEPVVETYLEPEPVVESQPEVLESPVIEIQPEPESSSAPSAASLKRLKKAELVELATIQGLDSSGTKADIIARLIG
ncbi:MAG: SAP domain-containing protein, partial [Candidatus Thermoplasmatota archaeon]|nr:SAP domain-containing protein [Candidatus Thermoplasmatota archaeon]